MVDQIAPSRTDRRPTVRPMERVLMLMALGLDPRYNYTDLELRGAWRRRMGEVHPDRGGNGVTAAAVNVSYLSLVGRVAIPRPLDVVL
jgi:hypothetical protein